MYQTHSNSEEFICLTKLALWGSYLLLYESLSASRPPRPRKPQLGHLRHIHQVVWAAPEVPYTQGCLVPRGVPRRVPRGAPGGGPLLGFPGGPPGGSPGTLPTGNPPGDSPGGPRRDPPKGFPWGVSLGIPPEDSPGDPPEGPDELVYLGLSGRPDDLVYMTNVPYQLLMVPLLPRVASLVAPFGFSCGRSVLFGPRDPWPLTCGACRLAPCGFPPRVAQHGFSCCAMWLHHVAP